MIDQGVDAGKIEVWPNGVNYKEFSSGKNSGYLKKELCLPEHSKIILCVCRLTPGKNPELAIRVLAKVRREHKDTFLVIVGQKQEEDYYNYLNTLIKDLDLGDSVRFLFDVNHRNMPPVYASADVYFLPSKPVESMNLASMEAMCAGLPVVTTKVSITPKIIEEAKCGYAVDGEDDAAEKLIYLLEHESERRSMGEKGREYVSENLVWETLTGKLEEIMKTLSERK
jgi:phosphatidylinositol alpha-1,6-mannosyltransferase